MWWMHLKKIHEGSIWTVYRVVFFFILHKSIFLHFVHHGKMLYGRYINASDIKKHSGGDGSGVKPNQILRKLYNSKYRETYGNRSYVISKRYIK